MNRSSRRNDWSWSSSSTASRVVTNAHNNIMTSTTSPPKSSSDFNNKEQQPRFRGTWNPAIADPTVTHFSFFNTPETKKATKALEVLAREDDDEDATDSELDVVVVGGKLASSSSSSPASKPVSAAAKLALSPDDEDAEVLLESKKRVDRLKAKPANSGLDLDALAEILIRTKAKQAAMVGLASGAPSIFLPGFGLFVGAGVDVALTSKLQFDLIMDLMWLYGREDLILCDKTKRRELVLSVMGVAGIDPDHPDDPNETEKAGERIAKRYGSFTLRRWWWW